MKNKIREVLEQYIGATDVPEPELSGNEEPDKIHLLQAARFLALQAKAQIEQELLHLA